MAPMAMRVTEMGESEGCPVIGHIEVASPHRDNITSPETELTSRWCSDSRPLEEPRKEAKQMTTAQSASNGARPLDSYRRTRLAGFLCEASERKTSKG